RQQLRQFQAAQGLFADGIAGPVTLMQLNRVAGLQEPRLNAAAAEVGHVAKAEQ
ncbi:MAG TPA: peptidoglycan-binding protein, partial [Noviherbaspirillum sp.]